MRQLAAFLALLCALAPGLGLAAEEPHSLGVGLIEVLELDFLPAPNPLVGSKAVLETRAGAHPKQLLVVGLRQGTSSLLISKQDGSLGRNLLYTVSEKGLDSTVIKIRRLLMSVEGISVEARDGLVVIDGEVLTREDKDRVHRVARGYPGVLDLTTISKLPR